ncbi:YCE I like family protein [Pedobacter sp. BAL39]|uniref:YceI family protein n=1 Tax=Pedobacter sp. BAL39 TaxID=391596 RepID=UPI0001559BEC|nr:YceI family protein [Pedobacter sp. BAL39]EDM36522.1 YCE I like family protein [Pedobacter sp. BAL39]
MKKTIVLLLSVAVLAACNNAQNSNQAATGEAQEASAAAGESFKVDSVSHIGWHATHKGGVEPHDGTIAVSEGRVTVDSGKVTGGAFTFDVANIKDTDIQDAEKRGQLEGHLKSPDFFDTAKFPTAKFEITKVEPFDAAKATSDLPGATDIVSGNLTFKDSTLNVTFPAKIVVTETGAQIDAKFNIDRTAWGLNYKGPNNPQDWMISKEVGLTIAVKAAK